jgi:hypothetical protein
MEEALTGAILTKRSELRLRQVYMLKTVEGRDEVQ